MTKSNELLEKRKAALAKLRQAKGIATLADRSNEEQIERTAPLSAEQMRLWVLSQMDPASLAFNLSFLLDLRGPLDVERLRSAVVGVIARHESLRTTFSFDGATPVQQVHAATSPTVASAWSVATQGSDTFDLAVEREARRTFQLDEGPLFRGTLFTRGENHASLLLTMHHIVVDGWSLRVIAAELSELYFAKVSAGAGAVFQYAEFAAWEREFRKSPEFAKQVDYWRTQLDPLPGALELSNVAAKQEEASLVAQVSRVEREISTEIVTKIEAFARSEGVTKYNVHFAAYSALLARHSQSRDFSVGVTIANRDYPQCKGTVGFFLNTVPIRVRISPTTSFVDHLKATKRTSLYAFTNPSPSIVEDLALRGRPEFTGGLFSTLFIFQNETLEFAFEGLDVTWQELTLGEAKFDVTLEVREEAGRVLVKLEADGSVFAQRALESFADQYAELLLHAISDPKSRVSTLRLLDEAAGRKILHDWNRTARESEQRTLHSLFEEQAKRCPSKTALVLGVANLSYKELNDKANAYARELRAQGLGTGDLVGLLLDKSLDMIVGVLAILKAGGAYVPLDPEYPATRLSSMIEDGGLRACLSAHRFDPLLAQLGTSTPVLRLDDSIHPETSDLALEHHADLPAYVIFTSGSTGRPKGVAISHRAIVARTLGAIRMYGVTESDRVLQFASLSFDASAEEIFPALAVGATLYLRTPELLATCGDFLGSCQAWQLSVLDLPTAYWHVLTHEMAHHALTLPSSVRLVILGGEKALTSALRQWYASFRSASPPRLVNTYGPTEATIVCSTWDVTLADLNHDMPIGRPTDNTELYVLDNEMLPVPVGMAGELYVGGVGLALGYLGRAELTAERFVPNPFGEGRLYRTGDLVRFRDDSAIEFVGRADHQVKIRGFRIELGEIEARLSEVPGVREAAVLVREDTPGMSQLVAYFVGPEVDEVALRSALASTLPDYMIPSAFVPLPAFPLTPNLKVDRTKLRAIAPQTRTAVAYEAPTSPTERKVATLWETLLRRENIGRNESFFEVGGHSLIAAQLIHRIRTEFGVSLPLRTVFQRPTIAFIASEIERLSTSEPVDDAGAPIERVDRSLLHPASFAQERLWVLDQLEPGSSAYNMPAALVLRGRLDVPRLQRAFERVVSRHEVLRTTYKNENGTPRQVIHPQVATETQLINVSDVAESERADVVEGHFRALSAAPFSLEHGPVFRSSILRVSAEEHVLLFCVHHIAYDGWSVGVLTRELIAFYSADTDGALPPLPVQYLDYAVWQRRRLDDPRLQTLATHWRAQLEGAPLVLDLPTDRPRPKVWNGRGGHVELRIGRETALRLRAVAEQNGATLFMALLAGVGALLSKISRQSTVVLGTPSGKRPHSQIEDLVGMFVNTLPLRVDLDADPTFAELIQRVRERCLSAYAHDDMPFEKLVDALGVERDTSRTPVFQAMLSFDSTPAGNAFTSDALQVEMAPFRAQTAKVDLLFDLREADGELRGAIEYASDLFDRATVEQMGRHLVSLLDRVTRAANARPNRISLLDEAEREAIVRDCNKTAFDLGAPECIHDGLAKWAKAAPEATALVFEGETLTYAALDEQSNRLARHLRDAGVAQDSIVAVFAERSLEMVVALFGILKAGAAYLPIDPHYPQDRVAYMLEDSRARIVLTEARFVSRLDGLPHAVWALDTGDYLHVGTASPLAISLHPESAAYVIYTSGSTGRPKGAINRHRAILNRLMWMQSEYKLVPSDVVLQKTPYSFDVSVWEFFWPIMAGSRLVIAKPEGHRDPDYLTSLIEGEGVTTLHFVPSMLRSFVDTLLPGRCASLRQVMCSGEALPKSLADAFFERSRAELHNLYGPTEAAVDVTFWACERGDDRFAVPLGHPIWNTEIYVVDAWMNPVPFGVAGEICIGGVSLARGYLARPDLTAEKFVPDPFSTKAGARMYRTGDLGRITRTGTIEYFGRIDDQVKVRGFRIELGEIETRIREQPGVRDSAVIVRTVGENKTLVAYVVADSEDLDALTKGLSQTLPEHMVPTSFVFLERLPVTSNGKLDRRALPAPTVSREVVVEPSTENEIILADVWKSLLALPVVSVRDSFFRVGGDSILALQFVSRARLFGLQLTARDVFEHKTLERIAGAARRVIRSAVPPPTVDESSWLLLPIQALFLEQADTAPNHFNLGFHAKARSRLDLGLLGEALRDLVTHHAALRSRYERVEGEWKARVVPEAEGVLLQADSGSESFEAFALRVHMSLDLAKGPLLVGGVYTKGDETTFVVAVHHIASDLVSLRVLAEDLEAAYLARRHGAPVILPRVVCSAPVWGAHLRALATEERFSVGEAEYWTGLAWDRVRSLPKDRAVVPTERAARSVRRVLPKRISDALADKVARRYRTEVRSVLVAALAGVMARRTESETVRIDLEGHGRDGIRGDFDLSRTVGWFTNLFPAVLHVPSGADVRLRSIKDQLRAIPSSGMGFGILRNFALPDIRTSVATILPGEVSFNYVGRTTAARGESTLFDYVTGDQPFFRSPEGARTYAIDILAALTSDGLALTCLYSGDQFDERSIEAFLDEFDGELRALATLAEGEDVLTPTDFPLVRLGEAQLATLIRKAGAIEDIYPLTPLQQGMLFHSLVDTGGGVYVEQLESILRGRLDVEAIVNAWNEVIARHPALRTSFHWEDVEAPVQVVHGDVKLPVELVDLRHLGEQDAERAWRERAVAARSQGLLLDRVPLMHMLIASLPNDRFALVLSFHHLILDGWSTAIVAREFMLSLAGQERDREPRPFRDYVAWLAREDDNDDPKAFWLHALENASPTLLARPESGVDDPPASPWVEVALEASAFERVREFVREHDLTLNTALLGAWAHVVRAHSGADREIILGSVVAGRPEALAGSDAMVGMFINTIPTRIRFERQQTMVEWLTSLQTNLSRRRPFEHTPLSQIYRWLGTSELFDHAFVFENYPVEQSTQDGLTFEVERIAVSEKTNFAITALVLPHPDHVKLRVMYDPRRCTRERAADIAANWRTAVGSMVDAPVQTCGSLSLLTGAELHRVIREFNLTTVQRPLRGYLHECFEQMARLQPDAPAVSFDGRTLSYKEFDERTNRLARHLRKLGVREDSVVGVCLERSDKMVEALFATMKAGAAYLPLDPALPAERIRFMLEDARARVICTASDTAGRFDPDRHHVVNLSEDSHWEHEPCGPLAIPLHAESAAYVIYTSGSTGQPKGVVNRHGSILNRIEWMQEAFPLIREDVVLQKTPFSFDVSVWEFFWPLAVGAKLVVATPGGHRDPEYLMSLIEKEHVTTLHFVPSMLQAFLAKLSTERCRSLTRVLCSGEALSKAVTDAFFERSHAELHNLYGPTEAAVDVTWWECTPRDGRSTVPLGRPISNTAMYVVDRDFRAVPIGVVGEICIGGIGLARGYLARAALTADRFVPDPYSEIPGARMYRTGDLGRFTPEGLLEYLGRLDHQVKVRGLRIELGEIEARLAELKGVRECAVLTKGEGADTQLVAFVVQDGDVLDAGGVASEDDAQTLASSFGEDRALLLVELIRRIPEDAIHAVLAVIE